MLKYLIALIILICPVLGHTQCTLSSGASTASIQSAINSAATNSCALPNRSTVNFGAGTYTISSQLSVPCPTSTMILEGPVPAGIGTTWPISPTVTLNSTLTNQHAFSGTACSVGTTFQYFNYNGGNPAGGGGGFLFVPRNMNHVTVQWNVMGGVSALQNVFGQVSDSFVWFDGPQGGTPRTQNATVIWNKFGRAGDCGTSTTGVMNLFGGTDPKGQHCTGIPGHNPPGGYSPPVGTAVCLYQGDVNYEPGGGYCAAVGVHVNTDNLVISNNQITLLEQGMKFFEGCQMGDAGFPACTYSPTNLTVNANDISGIHRISLEAQMNGGFTVTNNDNHDNGLVGTASWSLSMPQGGPNFINNNVLIQNVSAGTDKNGQPGYWPGQGIEMWGVQTQANNNLIQGNWNSGIEYGFSAGPNGTTFSNIIQLASSTQYIVDEYPQDNLPAPQSSGNVTGQIVAARASFAPTISPTPVGTYSTPIAVTITDTGYTSGAGPQGNTSVFYTTNGTNPTTSSTWCASPCSISVSPGTVVNAIGMWGALNQPRSYPNGYGFVPSGVVSAHYSAGSIPTLTGVTVSLQGGGNSIQVSHTVQACANTAYTGGSTGQVCGSGADTFGTTIGTWTSSTANATITTNGQISGVTAGSSNITAKATQGATNFTSPNFGVTVIAIAPSLTGITVTCPGTIQQGQTGNCTASCSYTGPQQTNCTTTDAFGNVASGWASSVPSFATVAGPVVTGVAVGTTQISAGAGGFSSSVPVQITSNAPPVATLTGLTIAPSSPSVVVGSTISFTAKCFYSDGSFTNCTTTDPHGSIAGSWTSSVTVDATINSTTGVLTGVAIGSTNVTAVAGAFTSPVITVPVTAAPGISVLGDSATDTAGATSPSYINGTYAVTGTNAAGYKAQSCTFYLPTGTLHTAGSKWDCGLVPAPTAATQSPNWLCWNTYTATGTTSDYGWHSLSLPTCGVLPSSSAYWVDVITNEVGRPGQGFSTCGGGACNGSAPTIGIGTYPYRFVSATYGVYTGMTTAMTATTQPGFQSSQYVTLATPSATLTGGFLANPGPTVTISVQGAVQFSAYCQYSDGTANICYPVPDQYGNTITAFSSDNTGVVVVGNIGSAHPGLATGVAAGSANILGTLTGGVPTSPWGLSVSSVPLPYPPSTVKVLSR